MKKYIWQIVLFAILVIIMASCTRDLHNGKYIVTDVRGRTVNLKGIEGDYYFPTDTLKIGDVVKVTRVKRESKANIW